MADTVASLDVVIDSSGAQSGAAQVKRSIEDIKARANDTAKSLKSIFSSLRNTIASIFGAYMVRNIARSFLEAARSAEDYRTSIRAVSSSIEEADATFDRIRKWAAVNPIDTDEAVGAFVRLRTAAVENSEGALNAIADLATVMHADMRDVASAVVTTETETLRNYGIILDRTGKQATIQMGNVRKTVEKDLDSIRAAIIEVIEESIGGSMQKAANTYSGVLDTMSGMWTDFQQDVMGISGKGPFDAVKNSLMDVRDEWEAFTKTKDYEQLVQEIQGTLVSAIETFRNGIELAGDAFLVAKNNADVLKGVVAALIAYKITLGLVELIGNLKEAIALTRALAAAQAATPVGLVAAGVSAVAGLAVYGRAAVEMKEAEEQAEKTKKAIAELDEQLKGAGQDEIKQSYLDVTTNIKTTEKNIASMTERLKEMREIATHPTDGLFGKGYGEREKVTLTDIKKLMGEIDAEQEKLRILRESEKHLSGMIQGSDSKPTNNGGTSTKSSSTSSSTKSAAELLVEKIRDEMQYLGKDGTSFLGVLDQWQSKLKPLSEDWKKITDLKFDILDDSAQKAAQKADLVLEKIQKQKDEAKELAEMYARADSEYLSSLGWENEQGFLSNEQYFQKLKAQVDELGLATKNVFNWTDYEKSLYSALQSAGLDGFSAELEQVNKKYEDGKIKLDEYTASVESLVAKWGNVPIVSNAGAEAIRNATEEMKTGFYNLNEVTTEWITKFQDGVTNAIVSGENLGDVLSNIGQELLQLSLKSALFGENGKGGMFGGVFSWIGGLFGSAKGNVFGPSGHIAKYAKGGVPGALPSLNDYVNSIVSSPTLFKFARGVGMMGEGRGPEGIFPLARTSSGELGVRAIGAYGAGASAPAEYSSNINITIQNNGSGEMTDKQAAELGQMCREQVKMQVAEEMYKWHRTGIFRNAYAR